MTDIQSPKQRWQLTRTMQLVGLVASVAAIIIGITNFLGYLVAECLNGNALLSPVFWCFASP